MKAPVNPAAWLERALHVRGLGGPYRGIRRIPGGSMNGAHVVDTAGGTVFVKTNDAAPPEMFLREREGLEALAGAGSSLRIPRVFLPAIPEKESPPILVLEYLEPLAGPTPPRTWEALGRGLAEIHLRAEPRYGFGRDNYLGSTTQPNGWMENWGEFFAERRIGHLVRLLRAAGKLAPDQERVYRSLMERIPARLAHSPPASLLHGDLWSGNFLATARGPALVDPAVYFGDREAEWAMMRLFGGFPETVFAAYGEVFPLPPDWRERLPLYQLYHLLNHQLLFGGGYGDQALETAGKLL